MSNKYDKSQVSMTHEREEEGTYHRREYSPASSAQKPVTTHYVERYQPVVTTTTSRSMVPRARDHSRDSRTSSDDDDDDDNFKEWTTSKRKVNHKTRQVETRVSRQLLVRGGEVIADSGPQVVTRIKEDNKVEECEKEKAPNKKKKGGSRRGFEALENAPEVERASGQVLGEKKEIQRVTREVREENMQYHDERFKELTGKDVHRKALQAPHELITINDQVDSGSGSNSKQLPRGKMVHYSNKGKTYQDTDEILEVAKMASDGSITKEKKHTKFHEESIEDELPDEKGEAEALRVKPVAERSSRRYVDYVNDFDKKNQQLEHYSDSGEDDTSPAARRKYKEYSTQQSKQKQHHDDEAFPRFQLDPLLNSLREEDFKSSGGRHREHVPTSRRRDSTSSSDNQQHNNKSSGRVEIPEEYRVNKQRLISPSGHHAGGAGAGAGSTLSQQSRRSSHRSRKEDAATQARLTDEEVGGRASSRPSSPVMEAHEKTTRYLERQSTPNSSRRYFYGDSGKGTGKTIGSATATTPGGNQKIKTRKNSITSSSSMSSIEQLKKNRHRDGATSRDSGFRSPAHFRSDTPKSGGEIYSMSNKHKSLARDELIASPTPSAGQRSVKTTTTTMSAGLADRPLSRADKAAAAAEQERRVNKGKVSKPPSPFQKFAQMFAPSNKTTKAQRQQVATR